MPIRNDREYRNLGSFEMREAQDDAKEYRVSGYASTFEPYLLFEIDGTECYERIDRSAFDDADLSDVVFLRDHEGEVFARNKNGTLTLTVDDRGLFTETDLSSTTGSREMYEGIEAGLYSQMSFAFTVADDGEEMEENADGSFTRVIKRFKKLYDVSAVSFPANPSTNIGIDARGAFNGEIEKRTAERLAAEIRKREREKLKLKIKLMGD